MAIAVPSRKSTRYLIIKVVTVVVMFAGVQLVALIAIYITIIAIIFAFVNNK